MDTEPATLQDYIALFRRRRPVMFATFSVVLIAVVFGTFFVQDKFRSTATIAIERPEIPENMVRTTFTVFDTDLRVERMLDRVLSRPNVEAWINEFGLYEDVLATDSMNAAVFEFREDVEVLTIQAREDIAIKKQGATIAFDVSYYGETPTKAVQVALALANQFLDENRASRSASVSDTVAFFQRDADRLELKIEAAEQKLAEFKEIHVGALPNSAFSNTQMLDRLERELDDVERALRDTRETRQILENELSTVSPTAPIFSQTGETILSGPDRLKLLQAQLVELSARYGPEHPDVIRTQREISLLSGGDPSFNANAIREELEIARREYAAAQQRYSAGHPDVVSLSRKVQSLEAQLANATAAEQTRQSDQPDNPAYIAIQVKIEAANEELVALNSRAREIRGRISEYEALISAAPQVEREYLALQREYDQAVAEFNEVREKQTDAEQALNLEASEKGERYVLQKTPSEPTSAAFPNRVAIVILGTILATIFALGGMLISEALDGKVRSIRDLRNLTGMPPIAVIPVLETKRQRRRRALAWSSSVVGVTALLIVMISVQV